jgi:hypothetical protein
MSKLNIDDDTPRWGAEAIGAEAGCFTDDGTVDVRKTYLLLEKRLIDASKVGRVWVSTRRRIHDSLRRGSGKRRATGRGETLDIGA